MSVGLLLHAFEPKCILPSSSSPFVLGFWVVDLVGI